MNFVQAINAIHNLIWGVFVSLVLLIFLARRVQAQPWLRPLVDALNEVHTNIWGVFIIAGGVLLTCCGQKEQGTQLIIGGFAILRGPDSQQQKTT